MLIIGIDYHPSFQQIASMDQETGEYDERRLNHSDGEAERFYRELQQRGVSVRVGMEATGYSRWFERLRCVDTRTLPRQQWPGNSRFVCIGCGATVGTIRNWSVSVRTRESSLPDMA